MPQRIAISNLEVEPEKVALATALFDRKVRVSPKGSSKLPKRLAIGMTPNVPIIRKLLVRIVSHFVDGFHVTFAYRSVTDSL